MRETIIPRDHNDRDPRCGYGYEGPDGEALPCECRLIAILELEAELRAMKDDK